jgi:hypothetical protein
MLRFTTHARALGLVAAVVAASFAPMHASAAPTGQDPPAQQVTLSIDGQGFGPDLLNVETGPVNLAVTTQGGPYQLEIPELVSPQQLPANTTTYVGFDAPSSGQYNIRLVGTSVSPATLNVCDPGFC